MALVGDNQAKYKAEIHKRQLSEVVKYTSPNMMDL